MMVMKIVVLLILVLGIFLSTVPSAQVVNNNSPTLSSIQIFPKDHILNTRVDTLPVDAKSDIYITNLVKDTAPYTGLRHYISNAIPYNVVNSTQPHQYITRFKYSAYSDNVAYPIPDNPLFEQGCYDYHMEIIDVDEMVLYELGGVEQLPDGSWQADAGAVWDLKSYSFRKNNRTPMWSTDAAGLPVFPGLVRYDEVSTGYINHSLRMTLPAMQNTWVWPARATSPFPGETDPTHPPAGQRFRLKASYDISGYPPQAKVILQALKTYGMVVADNTGTDKTVNVVGSPDTRWDYTDLNTLWRVNMSDFEAVDVSSLMIDPNSGQARTISIVSPTPPKTLYQLPQILFNQFMGF
jgi:hypothetical protein